ncbi:hypothetical protein EJP77_08130 [Paenibacillus zeisoli]|uniref:Uncharacterized protein n=1 Tax=Paenibacillus zeisoli TaxID=2496267 RepID=A0A3S1B9V3_9BACL|nr:hypothetical protein [Paenibacillus zeisoli]RUT33598.1 hypothetical protein EJP77_08130 [Paenibacillus zeisoli]
MGTSFVNLQIRSNSIREIEKILPGSTAGSFSDGWTTIISEHFQVGDIEKVAKKLSKAITQSVMSVEYHDDDVLRMSIYRNGKTMTSHITGGEGYGLPRKPGKSKVFIEELGFDLSEDKYLKAILACEDLGKKIELLQHFLGVTISIDHKMMLIDDSVKEYHCQRDLTIIEEYIKEASKRNRIKNQTKAHLLEEFEGAMIDILGDHKYLIGIPPYDRSTDSYKQELIYTFIPNGTLEPMFDVSSFQHRRGGGLLMAANSYLSYFSLLRRQYYLFDYDGQMLSQYPFPWSGMEASPVYILEEGSFLAIDNHRTWLGEYGPDFKNKWKIPFPGFPYYNNNAIYSCKIDSSGQSSELMKLNRSGQVVASLRLNYEGYHDRKGRFLFDEIGRTFYCCSAMTANGPGMKIFVLTEQMELIRELDLESRSIFSVVLDSKNHKLFVHLYDKEFLVIDTESFLILSRRKWEEDSTFLTVDSHGRAVVLTGVSSIVLLDTHLNDISRHRLKGLVFQEFTNERGNLCLLTGTEEGGAGSMKIRVYEIK